MIKCFSPIREDLVEKNRKTGCKNVYKSIKKEGKQYVKLHYIIQCANTKISN